MSRSCSVPPSRKYRHFLGKKVLQESSTDNRNDRSSTLAPSRIRPLRSPKNKDVHESFSSQATRLMNHHGEKLKKQSSHDRGAMSTINYQNPMAVVKEIRVGMPVKITESGMNAKVESIHDSNYRVRILPSGILTTLSIKDFEIMEDKVQRHISSKGRKLINGFDWRIFIWHGKLKAATTIPTDKNHGATQTHFSCIQAQVPVVLKCSTKCRYDHTEMVILWRLVPKN